MSTDIPVTFIIAGFSITLTLTFAVRPLYVLAVISVSPTPKAIIVPPLTVATFSSADDHVTFLYVALSGATVAVTLSVSPSFNVTSLLSSVTDCSFTTSIGTGPIFVAAPPSVR